MVLSHSSLSEVPIHIAGPGSTPTRTHAERADLRIKLVRFTSPTPDEFASGLLAYISIEVNEALRLDGLTVRCTRAGRIEVQYPERTDGRGHRRPFARPTSTAVRREIERQLHAALRAQLLPPEVGEIPGAPRVEA